MKILCFLLVCVHIFYVGYAAVDEPCSAESPCEGSHETCSKETDRCECVNLFVAVNITCYPESSSLNNYACKYSEQCSNVKDSEDEDEMSQCQDGYCTCNEAKWFISNYECIRGLGSKCGDNNECKIQDSTCEEGKCACKDGFQQLGQNNVCEPSSECSKDEDCPKDNGFCNDNHVCECNEGYVLFDNKLSLQCLPYATPENDFECKEHIQCSRINDDEGTALCKHGQCDCSSDEWYVKENEGNYKCVRDFGAECEADEECSEGLTWSLCSDDRCSCPSQLVAISQNHTCMRYSSESLDFYCDFDEQCSQIKDDYANKNPSVATCDEDKHECVCSGKGHSINETYCIAGIGSDCSTDEDCDVRYSECKNGEVCACEEGREESPDHECKEPECSSSTDCNIDNSECKNNFCVCKQGYFSVTLLGTDYCVANADSSDGYKCTADEMCAHIDDMSMGKPTSSKCIAGHCKCAAPTWKPEKNLDGKSKCVRGVGSQCSNTIECQEGDAFTVCNGGTCECDENHVVVGDKSNQFCERVSTEDLGFVCLFSEQCSHIKESTDPSKAAKCSNGVCSCYDTHSYISTESGTPSCVPGLGSKCSGDDNCKFINSTCDDSQCKCIEGQVKIQYKDMCSPYGSHDNDYSCEYHDQCSNIQDKYNPDSPKATCGKEGKCECYMDDWKIFGPEVNDMYSCSATLGATCHVKADCATWISNSFCDENMSCQCIDSYTADSNKLSCNSAGAVVSSLITCVSLLLVRLLY